MLSAILSTATVENIAAAAVSAARHANADAPDFARDFLIEDDACEIAGERMFDAALSPLRVDGLVTPFGYWARAARPAVAAVLAQSTRAGG